MNFIRLTNFVQFYRTTQSHLNSSTKDCDSDIYLAAASEWLLASSQGLFLTLATTREVRLSCKVWGCFGAFDFFVCLGIASLRYSSGWARKRSPSGRFRTGHRLSLLLPGVECRCRVGCGSANRSQNWQFSERFVLGGALLSLGLTSLCGVRRDHRQIAWKEVAVWELCVSSFWPTAQITVCPHFITLPR